VVKRLKKEAQGCRRGRCKKNLNEQDGAEGEGEERAEKSEEGGIPGGRNPGKEGYAPWGKEDLPVIKELTKAS